MKFLLYEQSGSPMARLRAAYPDRVVAKLTRPSDCPDDCWAIYFWTPHTPGGDWNSVMELAECISRWEAATRSKFERRMVILNCENMGSQVEAGLRGIAEWLVARAYPGVDLQISSYPYWFSDNPRDTAKLVEQGFTLRFQNYICPGKLEASRKFNARQGWRYCMTAPPFAQSKTPAGGRWANDVGFHHNGTNRVEGGLALLASQFMVSAFSYREQGYDDEFVIGWSGAWLSQNFVRADVKRGDLDDLFRIWDAPLDGAPLDDVSAFVDWAQARARVLASQVKGLNETPKQRS